MIALLVMSESLCDRILTRHYLLFAVGDRIAQCQKLADLSVSYRVLIDQQAIAIIIWSHQPQSNGQWWDFRLGQAAH
ncbi:MULTISPECIES: hypothetical protein [unclassified Roseofilum]|uniref:hypothetical protein n=1 Tax=unclassified Roseofilum TaxID=2620099 RepID=UPI001B037C90|nr:MULTISPECIES: hypothetical protein [unclassified Roseofilum]MBP0011455.1 hypothetical protein [Roseofilum sp. Belize Diploria]MBP0036061.1 hypothetical protein [Roseofilum sp. Belize BBD 4]